MRDVAITAEGLGKRWLIPLTGLAVIAALAGGVRLSAWNVRDRDIRYHQLNPMAGVLDGFRLAWLGQGTAPPAGVSAVSAVTTEAVLVLGLASFRHVERTFLDVS